MRAAEMKVVEEAKRTADGQFKHYYKVMGALENRSGTSTGRDDKKKLTPTKQTKK